MVHGHRRRCPPPPRPDPGRRLEAFVRPGAEVLAIAPEADEVPAEVEHRVRVLPLIRDVPGGRVTHREPRLDVGAREPAVARPLHRRPALVPARILRPVSDADRVAEPIPGDIDITHPDLVAVVQERRPTEREERAAGRPHPIVLPVAPAGGEATRVVVRPVPERPGGRREQCRGALDDLAHAPVRGSSARTGRSTRGAARRPRCRRSGPGPPARVTQVSPRRTRRGSYPSAIVRHRPRIPWPSGRFML